MLACAYEAPSLTRAGERLTESNGTSEPPGRHPDNLSLTRFCNSHALVQPRPFRSPYRPSTKKRTRRWT